MEPEGPAALPWDEKVRRVADVLLEVPHSDLDGKTPREAAEFMAERVLVAIGDANV